MRKHPKSLAALAATLLVGLTSTIVIATVVSRNAELVMGKNQQLAQTNQDLDDSIVQLGKANKDLQASNDSERSAKEEAVAVLSFFQDKVLAAPRPENQMGGLGIDATIRAAVDAAEPLIAESFEDQQLVEASIRDTLGMTYGYLGEVELALSQHERARALRESELGREHPLTLSSMGKLAMAYYNAGRVDEALPLLEETLELQKAKLGLEHPNTMMSMYHLAGVYNSADRHDEALPLLEQTLKLVKAKFGPEHPATIMSMSELAYAYESAEKMDEAIALYEQAVKLSNAKSGPAHPTTLGLMNNLALAYDNAGQIDEAIALYEETLVLLKPILGPEHPNTLTLMSNLAGAYDSADRHDEAIAVYEETLKLRKNKLGLEHADTLSSMARFAHALLKSNAWHVAETQLRECLEIREKTIPEDWHTFNTGSMLGGALLGQANELMQTDKEAAQNKFGEAEPFLVAGYEGMKAREGKIPANRMIRVTEALDRLIDLYTAWDKPEEAAKWQAILDEAKAATEDAEERSCDCRSLNRE